MQGEFVLRRSAALESDGYICAPESDELPDGPCDQFSHEQFWICSPWISGPRVRWAYMCSRVRWRGRSLCGVQTVQSPLADGLGRPLLEPPHGLLVGSRSLVHGVIFRRPLEPLAAPAKRPKVIRGAPLEGVVGREHVGAYVRVAGRGECDRQIVLCEHGVHDKRHTIMWPLYKRPITDRHWVVGVLNQMPRVLWHRQYLLLIHHESRGAHTDWCSRDSSPRVRWANSMSDLILWLSGPRVRWANWTFCWKQGYWENEKSLACVGNCTCCHAVRCAHTDWCSRDGNPRVRWGRSRRGRRPNWKFCCCHVVRCAHTDWCSRDSTPRVRWGRNWMSDLILWLSSPRVRWANWIFWWRPRANCWRPGANWTFLPMAFRSNQKQGCWANSLTCVGDFTSCQAVC